MKLIQKSKQSCARLGEIETLHGVVKTPCFCPIATTGTVKSIDVADLGNLHPSMILANTYHLSNRPGLPVIEAAGGLHKFMGWNGPILTDSGGFQVFSLGSRRFGAGDETKADTNFQVKFDSEGAVFKDSASGAVRKFTPEEVLRIERALGIDIAMVLDVCIPYPVTREVAERDTNLTLEWARRSLEEYKNNGMQGQKVFAIVQGSTYEDLRKFSAEETAKLDFDGFAIGGVSVGEPWEEKKKVLEWVMPYLPENKPRYLMGMGMPEEMVAAVRTGIDIFDCALPSRNARHGDLFVRTVSEWNFDGEFYKILHITNEQYKTDFMPPDQYCSCSTCKQYTRAFLRHLFAINEPLALRLATIHNLHFYLNMMEEMKREIQSGAFLIMKRL